MLERSSCTQTGRSRAIRFVALVTGVASLTAAVLSATPTRVSAQSPDPTRLPVATIAQLPLFTAYTALNVPSMAAGNWYLDPTTGARVYKLTSGSFPTSSANWGHDYSEGGAEVSLPHTGTTRTIKVWDWSGSHWLVDFTPGVGVSNPRQLTGNLRPYADIAFAFSLNPATPYYAFVANGTDVRRFDVRTMTEVPGNGFPVAAPSPQWFSQSENDRLFAWLQSGTGNMTAYEPSTGTTKTATFPSGHHVQVDKGGRYCFWSLNGNAGVIWDFTTGTTLWNVPGDPGIPFDHQAMARRRMGVTNWNISAPYGFGYLVVDQPNSQANVPGPSASPNAHQNGGWVQNPPDLNDQWFLVTHEGPYELSSGYLAPSGLILWTINGGRRLLAHHYNPNPNYTWSTFGKLSPDGAYVLFTSDMNGSGRSDVFLAEMPVGAGTVPVLTSVSPASITAGAASVVLTLNGSNFASSSVVQWNGASRATTFVSTTQLQSTLPATDVARPATAQVTVANPGSGTSAAQPVTISGPKADVGVYRASTGTWYILHSSDGTSQAVQWGMAGDVLVPGDYDGDGKTDTAVYRPSTGLWYILRSSDSVLQQVQWGALGDQPVPRDYDGDGKTDVAVYRPSTGTWYIRRSSDGTQQQVQWGALGDQPVPRDYDGDGKADLAVYRPSTGTWYIRRSSDGALQQVQWGAAGDILAPGDYDGDGKTDLAVYRPSAGTWYIRRSSDGTLQQVQWGSPGDLPAPRDYDGDGKTDVTVYRPSTGTWYIRRSSDGTLQQVQWGGAGDQPLPQ